ncbi:hypothetical protein F511_41683 [Dorcoceras hygrometricum]|uniref:Uncharacterized protein n=1 Tax=Dorcoceras hygrometricum TaxID=472368 RepID=A0A2Z7AJL1_9LAMI|nr:hypothetical protein F511_41683 [Dorcoceras hygrometricum]
MPTLTRSCDQQQLRATVLPASATNTGALPDGAPPVDAPAMLHRRDHLLVFAFVLPTPATNAGALPAGPPPDLEGSNVTDLTSNHGPTRENEPLQVDAPSQRRDAPLTTSTA